MNSQITTVGVDLAKNVIQVCKVEDNQVLFNPFYETRTVRTMAVH